VFKLQASDEDLEWNRSLDRLLQADHDRQLPIPAAGDDTAPELPSHYLARVRKAIEGLDGWHVRSFLTLGLFEFGSFQLWRDLDATSWPADAPLSQRPLVRLFLEGRNPAEPKPPCLAENELDRHIDLELRLVDKADGSQARALVRALSGETMLIEGPPGTGKSQTITNLIAAILARGQKVLFVSEKLAALEVVRRRLEALGLGEFCLELHSHKARKQALLKDLERALRQRERRRPEIPTRELDRFRKARDQLAAYGEALLADMPPVAETVYSILSCAASLRLQLQDAGVQWPHDIPPPNLEGFVRDELLDAFRTTRTLQTALSDLGMLPGAHPWSGVDSRKILPFDRERVILVLRGWRNEAYGLRRCIQEAEQLLGCSLRSAPSIGERSDAIVAALRRWQEMLSCLERARRSWTETAGLLNIDVGRSLYDLRVVAGIAQLANEAPHHLLEFRTEAFLSNEIEYRIEELNKLLGVYQKLRSQLPSSLNNDEAWSSEPSELREASRVLEQAGRLGFLKANVRHARRLLARLAPAIDRQLGPALLRALADVIDARRAIEHYPGAGRLGPGFRGIETPIDDLRALRAWAVRTLSVCAESGWRQLGQRVWRASPEELRAIAGTARELVALREAVEQLTNSADVEVAEALLLAVDEDLRNFCLRGDVSLGLKSVERLGEQLRKTDQAAAAFAELVALDDALWWGGDGTQRELPDIIQRADRALASPELFSTWLSYHQVRVDAVRLPLLSPLLLAVEEGRVPSDNLELTLKAQVYDALARRAREQWPILTELSGAQLADLVDQFRELDELIMEKRREAIATKLRATPLPQAIGSGPARDWTEDALIRHEISKQRRHIPVRRLVDRAGQALKVLKPCFMMGPQAVAQFLPPGRIEFDLLIIDEASQLLPEESIGALARAQQAVIVGDTKQLPPSSFFRRVVEEDEDDEDTGIADDAESIMEVGQRSLRDPARLLWHYRSRHECLIAWSNHEFYDNELIVFPSSHGEDRRYGIGFHHVADGAFAGGTNKTEADRVVDLVIANIGGGSHRSVGVAAMNAKQAELIEELLETRLAAERPDLMDRLEQMRQGAEPIFVKNLENVQGDERDLIIVSMTYGPEQPGGKVPQRFGPINRDNGWRRLNVLFTRARERMEIVSSMRSVDIVVGEAGRRGPAALRSILAYAETGHLPGIRETIGGEPDSDFEREVIARLERAGYRCVPQLGFAGFRIDIAVRDRSDPTRFLLAVECDGATYHSSRSARDRDRLRQDILEGLGWKVTRIWSTDWFANPGREIDRLLTQLGQLEQPAATAAAGPVVGTTTETQLQPSSVVPPTAKAEPSAVASARLTLPVAGRWTAEDVQAELVRMREEEIDHDFPDADRSRGFLRKAMLDSLLRHRPANEKEFRDLVPEALRSRTDTEQYRKYAPRVFALLAELD
jgi:very-short-patch-repair endonuclease